MSSEKRNSCEVGSTPCVRCGAPSDMCTNEKYLCVSCAAREKTASTDSQQDHDDRLSLLSEEFE